MTLLNQRIKITKGEFKGKTCLVVSESEYSLIADIKIDGQLKTIELTKDFFDIHKYNKKIIISKEKAAAKNAIAEWRYLKICKVCKDKLQKIEYKRFNRTLYMFKCNKCGLDYGGGYRKNKHRIPEGDWLPNDIPNKINSTYEVPGSKIQYEEKVKPTFEKTNKKDSIKTKDNNKIELIQDLNILSYESVQTFRRNGFLKLNELKSLSAEKLMQLGNLSFYVAQKLNSQIKRHATKNKHTNINKHAKTKKHTNIKVKNKTYLKKLNLFIYSKSKLNIWRNKIKSVKNKQIIFDEIILKFEKNKFNNKSINELRKLNDAIIKKIEMFDSIYTKYKELHLESSYINCCDKINGLIEQINNSSLDQNIVLYSKYNSIKSLKENKKRQINFIIKNHNNKVILAKKLEPKLNSIINNAAKLIRDNKLYDKSIIYYNKKINEKNKSLKIVKISKDKKNKFEKKVSKNNKTRSFRKKKTFLTLNVISRWIMIISIYSILSYLFYSILK